MLKPNQYKLFWIIFLLLVAPIFAYSGPAAFLTERVYADYNTNGSLTGTTYAECSNNVNPCRAGYVEIALPNANDTLQTVRVNLSGNAGTSLNLNQTYASTATSYPTIWGRTKIYVNDSLFGANQNYYNLSNITAAPAIELNVTAYLNQRGGYDIYDSDNTGLGGSSNNISLTLNISNPSASRNLAGVLVELYFDKNCNGANDCVSITSVSAGNSYDTDLDGVYDKANWTGTINAGSYQALTVYLNITEGINMANGTTSLTLDSNTSHKGAKASFFNSSGTHTGVYITAAYARGPVRQGIDLAERSGGGAWDVRGFIKAISYNSTQVGAGTALTYNISSWSIYNVSLSNGNMSNLLQSGAYSSTNFTADYGNIYTTDGSYSSNTSRATIAGNKPYVASSFDWKIVWNDTAIYNLSYINVTLNLPNLYKIDIVPTKSLGGYITPGSSTVLNITDTVESQSDYNAPIKNLTILSIIPRNTTLGSSRGLLNVTNDSIIISWWNGTTWTTIKTGNGTSNGVTVTITQSSGTSDGLINISIPDMSAVSQIGRNMNQSEKIKLFYNITLPSDIQMGDSFLFSGNATIVSASGTPETEAFINQSISSSGRQLIGYKDLFIADPNYPTLVNGTLVVQVIGGDITNIYFIDYVPRGTNFSCSTGSILFYNSTDGVTWASSTDISVNNTGTLTLPDGTVVVSCEYRNAAGAGWTLGGNKSVRVMYQVNISTPGLYEVPMGIAGFDPLLGQEIKSTVYGSVRVTVQEPDIAPVIEQDDFLVAKSIQVGSPVGWRKSFNVFNSNSRFTDAKFETEVFEDVSSGYATYVNEKNEETREDVAFVTRDAKRSMTWQTRLYPQETRNYDLHAITPPVLETDRDVEVLGVLEDKMVELRMSIFLRNMAKEDYSNVQLALAMSSSSIISITDEQGIPLSYTGSDSIKVLIPKIQSLGLEEVIIRYKQSYPKIIVTSRRDHYDLNSNVTLDILVIHGGEEIDYPYIETEVYTPDRDLVYANIKELSKLEPISKTNLSEEFMVPLGAPTGRYIAESRLRSDMATLATGTGNFYISGSESLIGNWMSYLIVLMAIGILYFGVRRIMKDDSGQENSAERAVNSSEAEK